MKKIVLLAVMAMLYTTGFGQSVYSENVKFKFVQLPMYPMQSDQEYACKIATPYQDDVKVTLENVRLENIKKQEEAAERLAEYNKSSRGGKVFDKMVMGDKKPSGKAKLTPIPYTQKIWNENNFCGQYVNIVGLEKNENAKGKILFTILANEVTVEDSPSPEKGIRKSVMISTPVQVEIFNANGEIIHTQLFKKSSGLFNTSYFSNQMKLDKKWGEIAIATCKKLENNAMKSTMAQAKKFLNEEVGYMTKTRKAPIYMVKEKKFTYPNINAAYSTIAEAYNLTIEETLKEDRESQIKSVIAVWENALVDKDLKNKKARINKKVVAGLYFNIAEANFWLNDFVMARKYLAKLSALNVNGFNKDYKKIDKTIKIHQKRHAANKVL